MSAGDFLGVEINSPCAGKTVFISNYSGLMWKTQ